MAGTRSDLTAAVNTALQAESGTGFCHVVELKFGQKIRARLSEPTVPDTAVSWTGRGDLTKLQVYTSVDDGLTWQRVGRSGDPIPKLAVTGDPPVYSAAHASTTNRRVLARLVFEGGQPGLVVDSFTLSATYEDGTTISRAESGASLGNDRLIGCEYRASVGGLVAVPEVSIRLAGSRGGLAYANEQPHDADDFKQQLHLSHGDLRQTIQGQNIEWQADRDDRYEDAAMAFEGWFRPEKTDGVICGWMMQNAGYGTLLEIVETTAGVSSKLRFTTREWDIERRLTLLQAPQIETGDDKVQVGRWHHFAFSYDGFYATLYLDAVVFAHLAIPARYNFTMRRDERLPIGIVIATNGRFVMGRHPETARNQAATTTSFQGQLSEWRFYSKALGAGAIIRRRFRRLDAAEIADMVADEGLAAYYPMSAGSGQSALDLSGNGNHLLFDQQQVGATVVGTQVGWTTSSHIWRGFPTGAREVLPGVTEAPDRSPGRETVPLNLDSDGEVLRVTDAPHTVTVDGKTYTGVGDLGAIEPVQESGDLQPTSAVLTLTGIKPQTISLALSAAYLDRPCTIDQVTFDVDGVQLAPYRVFEGRMDQLDVALGAQTGTVRVTAESYLRNWRRPINRRWNDEEHRALWADDHGFEFQGEMVDRNELWPARLRDTASTPEDPS